MHEILSRVDQVLVSVSARRVQQLRILDSHMIVPWVLHDHLFVAIDGFSIVLLGQVHI